MDAYLKNFKFDDKDIYEKYLNVNQEEIRKIIFFSDKSDEELYNETISSFEIIAVKVGEALNKFNGSYQQQKDVELTYYLIYNSLINYINKECFNKNDIKKFNNIFILISSQPKVTHFKIRFYSDLIYKIKNEGILDEYDEIALKDLVKTMQINLKLDQFIQKIKQDNTNDLKRDVDEMCNMFRFMVENFFKHFSDEIMLKNISLAQQYYE